MQEEEAATESTDDRVAPPPVASGLADRLKHHFSRNLRPATPPPAAVPKEIVDGLDATERGCGVASIFFALFWAVAGYFVAKHSSTKSIHDAADFELISNLVFALILVLGVAMRRRALLGFGALFFGLEQAFSYHDVLVGIPFLAFGGWLIMRANRKQKAVRIANGGRVPPRTPTSRKGPTKGPSAPKASKRYTPPRRSTASGRR